MSKRYLSRHVNCSVFAQSSTLVAVTTEHRRWSDQCNRLLDRASRIAATDFRFNFNRFSHKEALLNLRFRLTDLRELIPIFGWPTEQRLTKRNRYAVDPIIATCIILRRMAVPDRWEDICEMFGKHPSQLFSLIFWEGTDYFLSKSGHVLLSPVPFSYMEPRASAFASAIHDRDAALPNFVGFVDGTDIGVARLKGYMRQLVVYYGRKRKHVIKYQAVTTPDGIILHAFGPVEGRRHDWFMYSCSRIESNFGDVLCIDGKQYVIYGDSGYNWRLFMEVLFQGSNLSDYQKAFNTSMAKVRVTFEWIFKEVKLFFLVCDTKRKMKLAESPIEALYLGTMLLSNLQNCCYPNQISAYFGITPPSLEDYTSTRSGGDS